MPEAQTADKRMASGRAEYVGEPVNMPVSMIPAFVIVATEVRNLMKKDDAGGYTDEPSGAASITYLGQGGEAQLYCPKGLFSGWRPVVGDKCVVTVSIDGVYDTRITVRSIRPMTAAVNGTSGEGA